MPKIQGTVMVDELVLLYRGMGQHDKALNVRCTVPRWLLDFGIAPCVASLCSASVVHSSSGDYQQKHEGIRAGGKAVLLRQRAAVQTRRGARITVHRPTQNLLQLRGSQVRVGAVLQPIQFAFHKLLPFFSRSCCRPRSRADLSFSRFRPM